MQAFYRATSRITDPNTVADAGDIIDMKQAELGIKVNVAVIARANEMAEDVIDILA